ncbi:hypothetical protein ANO11243_013720 [Dothideomycetidae sp. 11243]|nr:hypothetical protein ANO11243_013720 [fungal sp. No.11243]
MRKWYGKVAAFAGGARTEASSQPKSLEWCLAGAGFLWGGPGWGFLSRQQRVKVRMRLRMRQERVRRTGCHVMALWLESGSLSSLFLWRPFWLAAGGRSCPAINTARPHLISTSMSIDQSVCHSSPRYSFLRVHSPASVDSLYDRTRSSGQRSDHTHYPTPASVIVKRVIPGHSAATHRTSPSLSALRRLALRDTVILDALCLVFRTHALTSAYTCHQSSRSSQAGDARPTT